MMSVYEVHIRIIKHLKADSLSLFLSLNNQIVIYLFIYYTVYAHIKSFTIVTNRKC